MTWILASRRNAFIAVLGLLLILDLGRSLYARAAFGQPFEKWDGAPYDQQLTTWPPASNVPTNATLGQKVYIENCAVCHGTDGDGKGIAAPSIYPRPRNFTLGQFKYTTTGPGQPPTDADLINTVSNGLPASPMPYFSDILSDEEIGAVVEYVKGFSPAFDGVAPESVVIPERVTPDRPSIVRGAELFKKNCATCHGHDAEGRTRAELQDAEGFAVYTRDLTAPWTFRGGNGPEQIWLRITNGLAPSPMPSFADTLTDEHRWDIVNYLDSITRPAPWETGGQLLGPGHNPILAKRGEYLVHYEMCGLCHTQVGGFGVYRDEKYLGGGMLVQAYPHGTFVSRNLTSDPTGLGNKSEEEIVNIIRNGQASDRSLSFWGMPWMVFHNFNEDDALAMAKYLKTLPPVQGQAPRVIEYGFVETTVLKLARGLPVAAPEYLTYGEGSYVNPTPGPLPDDWPQRALMSGQWLILVGGLGLMFMAGPKESRLPRGAKGWLLSGIVMIGSLLVALVVAGIYSLPGLLPSDAIASAVRTGLHEVQESDFDSPEQYALAKRGEYLYTTTACMFCHGSDGRGGGKLSGQGVGTIWTRNISQHPEAGIGKWSDVEIARAIRSGISADGRPLYWQGMPWDHFGNMDEEDVLALVAYLKTIPPVDIQVPDYVPPSPDDCVVYTFWVVPNNEPGCK